MLYETKLQHSYDYMNSHIITDDNYDGAPDSNCPMGRGNTEVEAIIDYWEQVQERQAK
jgi:hypothetical protein